MTDGQILAGAAIVAFAIFYFVKFLRPMMNKGVDDIDEIDISLSRFKRRRAEKGLCLDCGSTLSTDWPPPAKGQTLCSKCQMRLSYD